VSSKRRWFALALIVAGVTAASMGPSPRAQESAVLAVEAAGIVSVDVETWLRISDVAGQIYIRAGKEDELRFLSTLESSPRDEIAVELSATDRTFWIRPEPGTEVERRRLEVSVPEGLSVTIEAKATRIAVNSIGGRVEIQGETLEIHAGALGDSIELDVQGGTVDIRGVEGDLTLRGTDLHAAFSGVSGLAYAVLSGGQARVARCAGEVELDLDGVDLQVDGAQGPFQLRGRRGKAEITGLASGGELNLEDTLLVLSNCVGDLDIESDSEIRFRDNEASIHIMGYGASLRGSGNMGLLEIVTHGSEVVLEKVRGPVRVQGHGLDVRMSEIGGEVVVLTNSSNIELVGVAAPVTVENDYGDITVERASDEVTITNREGNVRLTDMKSAVQVDADGEEVTVWWSTLDPKRNSKITNEGGDVSVKLPAQGGCRVQAKSHFGRIESGLPDVVVSDDGSSAEGMINRRSRPALVIESQGVVRLSPAGGGDEES
jgi:hypothetical protein